MFQQKTLFSLRTKLFLAFFFLAAVMIVVISYTLFNHMQTNHFDTLKRDLRVIVELGAEIAGNIADKKSEGMALILRQLAQKDTYIDQVSLVEIATNKIVASSGDAKAVVTLSDQIRAAISADSATSGITADVDRLIAFAVIPGMQGSGRLVLVLEVDQSVIDKDIRHFMQQVVGAATAAFIFIAWVSWILARNFNRRIEALQKAVGEMADGKGELDLRVDGRDEVAQLASCIKKLAAKLQSEREGMLLSAIESLVMALETKDEYTYGHSSQVSSISVAIGREMGMNQEDLFSLRVAALLHDIGKIGIPDQVLNKRGSLTEEEWELIKKHPGIGARIIAGIPLLQQVGNMVLHHHARWDGRGYPEIISGSDIPIGSRIIAVADTYQAMTSDRPYRKGLSAAVALSEIQACSGKQFDPAVVDAFCRISAHSSIEGVA